MVGAQHEDVVYAILPTTGEGDDVMGMQAFPARLYPAADLTAQLSPQLLPGSSQALVADFRLVPNPLTVRPIPVSD